MTIGELQNILDGFPERLPVVIEGRLQSDDDTTQIHDVQLAIGTNGQEEVHLIAADGIRDK